MSEKWEDIKIDTSEWKKLCSEIKKYENHNPACRLIEYWKGRMSPQMIEDVKKIKEAIYNPEQGLYARVRDLEQWQQNMSKFIWSVGLAVAGLVVQAVYSNLF